VPARSFRIVTGCPCPAGIAPYIYIVIHADGVSCVSIYRGTDATTQLHQCGKSSQAELYALYKAGRGAPANRPGQSTHELYSDGVAYPSVPLGHALPWWCQGFDIADPSHASGVIHQARIRGWEVWQPYPGGAEAHHLNFRSRPRPSTRRADANAARIRRLRDSLPRRCH
jgi:hypothetical protein